MSGRSLESYPHPFRRSEQPRVEEEAQETEVEDGRVRVEQGYVPVIDAQSMMVDPQVLGEACRDWGVFHLVNHGIPPALLTQIRDQAKQLFSLPLEAKQALVSSSTAAPLISYFWGTAALAPSGATLESPDLVDRLEGFNVRVSQLHKFPKDQTHHHPLLGSLALLLREYGDHLGRLARLMYEALGKNLKLDPALSCSNLDESTGLIRLYRYFPGSRHSRGLKEHTDSSLLAILTQNTVGGLQVLKDGRWLSVQPLDPNSLIVNLGDMLQALSDDEYKSVEHRVVVYEGEEEDEGEREERVSVCYFVFPAEEGVIRSSCYRPFTYAQFRAQVQRDVRDFGLKLGLQHFKRSADGSP